jgi:hypothetical protein
MNPLRRIELMLNAVTVLCVIVFVAALLWRPRIPDVENQPMQVAAGAAANVPYTAATDAGAAIIAANIFSASRSAPPTRYNPLAPLPEMALPPVMDTAAADTALQDPEVPKLLGTITGAAAAALMRLDPAIPGAQLYRVGERGGVYQVIEINSDNVVLTGPRGRMVVRMSRSNERRPDDD